MFKGIRKSYLWLHLDVGNILTQCSISVSSENIRLKTEGFQTISRGYKNGTLSLNGLKTPLHIYTDYTKTKCIKVICSFKESHFQKKMIFSSKKKILPPINLRKFLPKLQKLPNLKKEQLNKISQNLCFLNFFRENKLLQKKKKKKKKVIFRHNFQRWKNSWPFTCVNLILGIIHLVRMQNVLKNYHFLPS